MNTYEIEGRQYRATNEYNAVKEAYKCATVWNMISYNEDEQSWIYKAIFNSGEATVKVKKMIRPNLTKEIETRHANARIIAAAPDMLDALIGLERWAKEFIPDDWDDSGYHFIRHAKQALEKAIGSTKSLRQ